MATNTNSTRSFSRYPVGSPEYNNEDIGGKTVAVTVVSIVVAIIFTGLRFWSSHIKRSPYAMDDFFIIPSLVTCTALSALSIVMVEMADVGRHMPYVKITNPPAVIHWAKSLVVVELFYGLAVIFSKLSILSFYLRIFTSRTFRIGAYVVYGTILANACAGFTLIWTACIPFNARWHPEMVAEGKAKCIDVDMYWRWISFANILTDFVMLALPWSSIWSLHTSKNQKVGLTLMFLTGSIGMITSIVRFVIFYDTQGFIDGTWTSATLMIWTVVEPCIYHVAACLPTLRLLFLHLFGRKNASTTKGTYVHSLGHSGHQSQDRTKNYPLIGHKSVDSRFQRLDDIPLEESQHAYDVHVGAQKSHDNAQRGDLDDRNRRITVTQGYTVEREIDYR